MLNHKDWFVWITVDGQELPQYQTTIDTSSHPGAHSKVSCWIASEENKEFGVHILQTKPEMSPFQEVTTRASLSTDGAYVAGGILKNSPNYVYHMNGRISPDGRTETPFVFSSLSLTDDESALRDVSHLKDLGIISVTIDRIEIRARATTHSGHQSKSVAEQGAIHETSKKAGAHCVSFGKPKPRVHTGFVDVTSIGDPLVTFEFRYRSADMLRAQGIIPAVVNKEPAAEVPIRARQPKLRPQQAAAGPSGSQRKVKREDRDEEDVDEEIRALRERLNSLEKRRDKENIQESTTRPRKKAKVEPLNHSNFIDGEIIDLT